MLEQLALVWLDRVAVGERSYIDGQGARCTVGLLQPYSEPHTWWVTTVASLVSVEFSADVSSESSAVRSWSLEKWNFLKQEAEERGGLPEQEGDHPTCWKAEV